MTDPWEAQREALGAFIREQRKRANLSLRQLAELTSLSNPYLSQVERGLHQPSVRVLRLLSDALNVSAETLLTQAGLLQAAAATVPGGPPGADGTAESIPGAPNAAGPADLAVAAPGQPGSVESAVRADQRLTAQQQTALIAVYHSMLGAE
jgi:transcriptional regulator with XRE-family HTH domain